MNSPHCWWGGRGMGGVPHFEGQAENWRTGTVSGKWLRLQCWCFAENILITKDRAGMSECSLINSTEVSKPPRQSHSCIWKDKGREKRVLRYELQLPTCLSGKESACQCRRCRFNPWVRKIPWRRKWQPTPVFLPGESHGQRSRAGYIQSMRLQSRIRLSTHACTDMNFFLLFLVFP